MPRHETHLLCALALLAAACTSTRQAAYAKPVPIEASAPAHARDLRTINGIIDLIARSDATFYWMEDTKLETLTGGDVAARINERYEMHDRPDLPVKLFIDRYCYKPPHGAAMLRVKLRDGSHHGLASWLKQQVPS